MKTKLNIDVQQAKVLAAEAAVKWDFYLATTWMLQEWLDEMITTKWYREQFGSTAVYVYPCGAVPEMIKDYVLPAGIHIYVPEPFPNKQMVLHRLAHALAKTNGHGRKFCLTYLKLVRGVFGKEIYRELRRALVAQGVKLCQLIPY